MGEDDIAGLAAGTVGLIEFVVRILDRAVAAGRGIAGDVNDVTGPLPSGFVSGFPPVVVLWARVT